ncbi:MAG: uroporphyrinogen decarboxylase family protein [Anaerolineae bacterium]
MTGREKIEAAFSLEGTPEIPAVICYEGIYIRDHWSQLTDHPWWYAQSPDIEQQLAWRRDVITKTGQDWFYLPSWYERKRREDLRIEVRPEGVFRVSGSTGAAEKLEEPQVAGWNAEGEMESIHPEHLAETWEEIDALVPLPPVFDSEAAVADGRADLAKALLQEFGHLFPIYHVGSPLWLMYNLWGFEGMMVMIASRPELVSYACERQLVHTLNSVRWAAALGAAGIWIEECLTDMISPQTFATLNVPLLRCITDEIRSLGMKSIYYYCGDPAGKWEHLLSVGADALSLEESKKGFEIDIEDVVGRVEGRCTVLGNLDAINLLERGSESELRTEIARQIAAGRHNGSRFIMSIGSPVTPGTTVARVRRYCDLVHALGS